MSQYAIGPYFLSSHARKWTALDQIEEKNWSRIQMKPYLKALACKTSLTHNSLVYFKEALNSLHIYNNSFVYLSHIFKVSFS